MFGECVFEVVDAWVCVCVGAVVNYLPLFYEAILVCAFLSLKTE